MKELPLITASLFSVVIGRQDNYVPPASHNTKNSRETPEPSVSITGDVQDASA
jgi:hypothetical protein